MSELNLENLQLIRKIYQLKNVERSNSVKRGKESSAEHSWSCLILADFFLNNLKENYDRLKVYEFLMYHDLVEIETGDVCISDEAGRNGKKEREFNAMNKLKNDLPDSISKKFVNIFKEYEKCETKEAKLARIIDVLDAQIHEMDYKEDWKGWTANFLIKKKGYLFEEFPELKKLFFDLLALLQEEGYFDQ